MSDPLNLSSRGGAQIRTRQLARQLDELQPFSGYIVGGQSNAQGAGEIPITPDQMEPLPGMYMLDEDGEIVPARYPLFRTPTENINTSHRMSAAWVFAKRRVAAGENVLLIGAAVNGSGMIAPGNSGWVGPGFSGGGGGGGGGDPQPGQFLWANLDNQLGINGNFTNRFEDGLTSSMRGNLRYACERARIDVTGVGSGSLAFDQGLWPTVTAAPFEAQPMDLLLFVDLGTQAFANPEYNSYLGDDNQTLEGLEELYPPGRYWVEVRSDSGAADANFTVIGDNDNIVQTQDQTETQPAIFRFDVSNRTRTGLRLRITAPAGQSVKLTDLLVYHDDDAAHKGTLYWRDSYVQFHRKFTRFRDMEARHENELGALISNLTEEPGLSWCTFSGIGPPPEFTVPFCNLCKLDYQMVIPASAALNIEYLDNRAAVVNSLLDPDLRVMPHASNEVWHGNGINDGLNPAIVFNQVHAVNLGLQTLAEAQDPQNGNAFQNRILAQAEATGLIIERFSAVFQSTPGRFVAIVESQNGNAGPQSTLLDYVYNGTPLYEMLDEFHVAPYLFPNGTDTVNWFLFNPEGTVQEKADFFNNVVIPNYTEARDGSLASLEATRANVHSRDPNIIIACYESMFQDGLAFGSAPLWTTDTVATFNGFQVLFQAEGSPFPTLHQSKYNHVFGTPLLTPSSEGFVPEEWIDTGQLPLDEYTPEQRNSSLLAMTIFKGTDEARILFESGIDGIRAITPGCNVIYKGLGNPGLQGGWRNFGTEAGEPSSVSVDYTFTGPWAPQQMLLNRSTRPNGEVPQGATGSATSGDGAYFQSVVDRVNGAIGRGYNIQIKGIFWAQGEADGNNGVSQADYTGAFEAMLDGWDSLIDPDSLGKNRTIPAVITDLSQSHQTFGFGGFPAENYRAISESLRDVANRRSHSAFVESTGLTMVGGDGPNGLHYDDDSIRELGRRWDTALTLAETNWSGEDRGLRVPLDTFESLVRYPRGECMVLDNRLYRSLAATGPGFVNADWEVLIDGGLSSGGGGGGGPADLTQDASLPAGATLAHRFGTDILGPAPNVVGTHGAFGRYSSPAGSVSYGAAQDAQGELAGINLASNLLDRVAFLRANQATVTGYVASRIRESDGQIETESVHQNLAIPTLRSRWYVANVEAGFGVEVLTTAATWFTYGVVVEAARTLLRGRNEISMEVHPDQDSSERGYWRMVRNGPDSYELVFERETSAGETIELFRLGQDTFGSNSNAFLRIRRQDGTYVKALIQNNNVWGIFDN